MSSKLFALTGVALAATTVSTQVEARTQMRAVGSSTVYPFAKQVAERGARPLYVYVKNAHVGAIPAIRALVAEFTKESSFGPNGYLRKAGMIASPTPVRARSQQASRSLAPLNLASLK